MLKCSARLESPSVFSAIRQLCVQPAEDSASLRPRFRFPPYPVTVHRHYSTAGVDRIISIPMRSSRDLQVLAHIPALPVTSERRTPEYADHWPCRK